MNGCICQASSRNRAFLATAGPGAALLYSTDGKELLSLDLGSDAAAAALNARGDCLAVLSRSGTVEFRRVDNPYPEAGWKALVRDFYANHHCRTPLFPEVSREFLRYLQDERGHREDDPPFLLELAHYEWIELALDLDERTAEDREANPDGDLLDGVPVLTPLLHVLSYRYPVHEIGPDYRPAEAPEEATHLLVYRDRNDRVKFMQLNGVSRLLLGYLQERSPGNGRELLERVAREINHPDPGKVVSAGADLLEDLRKRGILLGTLRTS